MNLSQYGVDASLSFTVRSEDYEYSLEPVADGANGKYIFTKDGLTLRFLLEDDLGYVLSVASDLPVSIKMEIIPTEADACFHVIPCNTHGDNNLKKAKPGYFPNLTHEFPGSNTSSDEWEFRADRASHPVSMVHTNGATYGISIEPYSLDQNGKILRNGVFSKLPSSAGVSLGYRNYPLTFTFKEMFTDPTYDLVLESSVRGKIYQTSGNRLDSVSVILKEIYEDIRECPEPSHGASDYLKAFLDSYENINWSHDWQAFTNMECRVPGSTELKPWRPLFEIGWSGTGVVSYPLLSAQSILGTEDEFTKSLIKQFDAVADSINPSTGMLYDLTRPLAGSRLNGWWAGYMVSDCHCAYTNGSGAYYLLKAYVLLKKTGIEKISWLTAVRSVLDTVLNLQSPDGNYGYTYSPDKPEVIDSNGFAGCWFATVCALMYSVTGEEQYLSSARKALRFYHGYVKDLECSGTPMDTWKSIDQEGNLAFIRAAALLHGSTGDMEYLKMLEDGAAYEYLWRYAFRAKPEFPPLKDSGWNSCGGSVTSVSNPHIHPMGVNITADLLYLYRITGDEYHLRRAEDGLCWGLATADLYPGTTGYGRLGVMTERYCPSDGLVIERFSDTGKPSSIWFTFNGWAGASVLEGLTETLLSIKSEYTIEKYNSVYDIFKEIKKEVTK